jgi:putative ABC transport system permease protein
MRFIEFDDIQEIIDTMRQNKLRTFLTGFAVAWGIFMLIILLGSGQGLKNGISSNFNDRATNTVNIWGRRTTMPYKGYKAFRRTQLTNSDLPYLKNLFPEIDKISGHVYWQADVSYKLESGNFEIEGVMPDMVYIDKLKLTAGNGRFLNEIDMKQERKVVVITQKTKDLIFKQEPALGKFITLSGIPFQVVGIDTKESRDENGRCYIPHSTAQKIFNKGVNTDGIHMTVIGLYTKKANDDFAEKVRLAMCRKLIVHPDDTSAFNIWNQASDYVQTMNIFKTIDLFVLFIGICTLIAGVVGVGNIMVITVKERTREFGIRKALGATPMNILGSILLESVVVTSLFGYVGMMLGIGILEIVNKVIGGGNNSKDSVQVFKDPSVDLRVVALATIILIISGLIAGYIPARKAVRIKPIDAIRSE